MQQFPSSNMWPMLLDYSDDECKRILRKLELEAYASIISAFRAQGELNKEKKKMLQDLSVALSISIDRHRAEIRRAINDEHLNTIADRVAGPNTSTDWAIEGRRVIPLMPRCIPQTAYLSIANYAADAQSAKNATLPVPSATGYQRDILENGEHSRKRCSSPIGPHVVPEKFVALEHSPILATPNIETIPEEKKDVPCQPNSTVPRCVHQSIIAKDSVAYAYGTRCQTQPTKLVSTNQKIVNVASLKNTSPLPMTQSFQQVKSTFATSINAAEHSISSSEQPHLVPNSSTFTQSVSMLPSPVTTTFVTRPRAKLPTVSKTLMRPRLPTGSSFNPTVSQPLLYQNSSSPFSTSNLLHKGISPLKFRSSISTLPSASPHPQSTVSINTGSQTSSMSVQMPRMVSTHRTPSPVLLKQSQSPVTLAGITKSAVNAKILTKPTAVRTTTVTPRAMVTSVSKASIQKVTPVVVTSSTMGQQQTIPVKTSFPAQILGNAKNSATITYSQKVLPGPAKVTAQPVAKTIHYRNEGGLKIISQNMASNRLIPKMSNSGVSQSVTSCVSRFITTTSSAGMTGSARIVNFSQPVSARFARALPPSSIAAVNLVNSLPVSGLRVTMPVGNTSMVRTALPAKPNVIVVHKAQVWPQTPSATIVMTSSGSFTRLSNEAIEEAVTLVQRQDATRVGTVATTSGLKSIPVHHALASSAAQVVQTKAIQAASCKIVEIPSGDIATIRPQIQLENVQRNITDSSPDVEILSEKKKEIVPTMTTMVENVEKFIESSAIGRKGKLPDNQQDKLSDEPVVKQAPSVYSKPDAIKTICVSKMENEAASSNESNAVESDSNKIAKPAVKVKAKEAAVTHFSLPDFNLDQLQEGQILELRAQDAAELLSHHGQLSTEVIELLQQAGLQLERFQIPSEKADEQECIELDDDDSQQSVKEIVAKPKISDQVETIETSILADDIEISSLDNTVQTQVNVGKNSSKKPESQDDDIYMVPVDSETSNQISVSLLRSELSSLQATESLGDSSLSQSPPTNSALPIEIEEANNIKRS